MEQKIQLQHPAGKKAIAMDLKKYSLLETAIVTCLTAKKVCTHKELFTYIIEEFSNNNIQFSGSIEWHMEWVKLDLEARGKIIRIENTKPVQYQLR